MRSLEVGCETTQQLDTLRKELADSETTCGEYMQKCDAAQAKLHDLLTASAAHIEDVEAKLKAVENPSMQLVAVLRKRA